MKKVMMSVALISAIAIAAGYSMIGSDKSEENVADLTSANVEALAQTIDFGVICADFHDGECGYLFDDLWVEGEPVYDPSIQQY